MSGGHFELEDTIKCYNYSRKEKVLKVKNQTFMVTDLVYQFQMVC